MKASFFEYHVAMSGINTARANLGVVGHNTANAGIPGYSRQQTVSQAARPISLYDGKGMYGTGSQVLGIKQIRDKYLDKKYWQHQNVFGEYKAKNTNLEMIETVFNDLTDTGVLSCFSDYFGRLQDLSQSSDDATYRGNVLSAAETLTELIRTNAEALQKHQRDINSEIGDTVSIINSLGVQIADISEQISNYEMDGSAANDLRDQRVRLVDQLSEYVNLEATEVDYSTDNRPYDLRFTVTINGHVFVKGDDTNPLVVVARGSQGETISGTKIQGKEKRNEMDIPGLYDIFFASSGAEFDIYSITLKGTLKGLVDVRDGNGGVATEPKKSVYTNGEPGSYVNADTTDITTDGVPVDDLLDTPNETIDDILGTNGGEDILDDLLTRLNALDPDQSNYRLQLKNIANELFSAVTNADYALKDLIEVAKAALPATTTNPNQTQADPGSFEAVFSGFNSSAYSSELSAILNGLQKVLDSTTMEMSDEAVQDTLSDLLTETTTNAPGLAGISGITNLETKIDNARDAFIGAINAANATSPIKIIVKSGGTPPSTDDMLTTTTYKGIPFYMNKLNTLVRTFARSMNEGLDFKFGNIPQSTTGNIMGHMYGYGLNEKDRSFRLLFTSSEGVTEGKNPSDFGGLTMWKCTYKLDNVEYNETLTSNNDVGPDLPPGAVLSSSERLYVWESVYTVIKDGEEVEVRNIELANKNGPTRPDGATYASGYPQVISNTTVDYSELNAFNFVVNPDLLESGGTKYLACASDPDLGESANDVILGFGKIGEYSSLFREGKLLDFIIGTNDQLAIDKSQSEKFEENYTEIKLLTENQRISVSGVDDNEESMNMIRYQQQFLACSKLVNVINQIYDTLINRLGV